MRYQFDATTNIVFLAHKLPRILLLRYPFAQAQRCSIIGFLDSCIRPLVFGWWWARGRCIIIVVAIDILRWLHLDIIPLSTEIALVCAAALIAIVSCVFCLCTVLRWWIVVVLVSVLRVVGLTIVFASWYVGRPSCTIKWLATSLSATTLRDTTKGC